jgi:hypothetical protein
MDLNLAPIIFANQALLAWTRWDIWIAQDWKNVSYYKDGSAPNWNDPNGQWEGEEPSMWVDRKGRFHIISSHNGQHGEGGTSQQPEGDWVRHLFPSTGRAGGGDWIVAPLPKEGGCAFPRGQRFVCRWFREILLPMGEASPCVWP